MRQRLTDLEGEVQKAYTKKQVLIARDKAREATLTPDDLKGEVWLGNSLRGLIPARPV